ncbi:hypothetical protein [Crossiella cryophila]|uniref:Uncharacterized protein n=1 Tax=Crossiella cryophila TaxID=43355 RepID=A0A7W7CC97_9PSEU|nr:hypothetical protein [Crossiella cryophila]MBB4678478.1 hypothetical protein [Crossiella cryophila]
MKMPITVHQARLDGRDWRVIRPAGGLAHAEFWDVSWQLWLRVDRGSAYRLGILWLLAARSKHTIIHLPLRNGDRALGGEDLPGQRKDLVLCQHSLQLRASLWPRLRSALDKGKPQTVHLPDSDLPDPDRVDRQALLHRDNQDLLNERSHADTVFLSGSAPVFRHTADRFFDLAFRAPGTAPGEDPADHVFSRIDWDEGVLGNARGIHVEYRPRWASATK